MALKNSQFTFSPIRSVYIPYPSYLVKSITDPKLMKLMFDCCCYHRFIFNQIRSMSMVTLSQEKLENPQSYEPLQIPNTQVNDKISVPNSTQSLPSFLFFQYFDQFIYFQHKKYGNPLIEELLSTKKITN